MCLKLLQDETIFLIFSIDQSLFFGYARFIYELISERASFDCELIDELQTLTKFLVF